MVGDREPCQLDDVPAQGTLSAAASVLDRKWGSHVGEGTRLGRVESINSTAVVGARRVRNPEVPMETLFLIFQRKRDSATHDDPVSMMTL